jgi:hypothetical protein
MLPLRVITAHYYYSDLAVFLVAAHTHALNVHGLDTSVWIPSRGIHNLSLLSRHKLFLDSSVLVFLDSSILGRI